MAERYSKRVVRGEQAVARRETAQPFLSEMALKALGCLRGRDSQRARVSRAKWF